ncbi:hypothetical protein F53441_5351 [Fusarium austroafricanum]|uniref:BTB domain-containing protein n=1 Tax=Fusarium austroafricanum TaxID=2364996 RepID=A0A8H4KI80_9HYPO|nr:hypothetical protein F53441_5351 [Fusarium austroafricanum]
MPDRNLSVMEEQKAWMQKLLSTGEYSDIDLISTHKVYEVHRAVVCSWSPVIKRSCEFNAINQDRAGPRMSKSDNGIAKALFNFGDADPWAVHCMMQFFYSWDYEDTRPVFAGEVDQNVRQEGDLGNCSPTTDEGQLLILHSKVFTLAHMYDIPRLRELSVDKFEAVARLQWNSHGLLDAAREAYTSTPSDVPEMRGTIVKTFYENRELLDEDYVHEFLLGMPHLTLDLLMYINKHPFLSDSKRKVLEVQDLFDIWKQEYTPS